MRNTFVIIILSLGLVACGTSTTSRERALANVSATQASLAASGRIILACYTVPHCNAVAPKAKIKAAYGEAYTAVTAAQASADAGETPNMTASTAAMQALQGLVNQLPPS